MSTENENDISRPHGLQQNIKMELMGMIHSAENPFDIICHIADYLEEVSAEDGYANHVRENLRAVYGLALGERKLLTDELADVIARGKRIKEAYDTGDFTEEEKKRIEFAVILHRKNAQRLKELQHVQFYEHMLAYYSFAAAVKAAAAAAAMTTTKNT